MSYTITFDRIGRHHNIGAATFTADNVTDLAEEIWKHARPYLRSNDVEVYADIDAGTGRIAAGGRTAGTFTITPGGAS